MKKVMVLCLAVFMLLGLSACSQQAVQKTEMQPMETGPGAIPRIDYAQAEMHIGEEAMVCGKVLGTKTYSNFGVSVVSVGTPSETPGGFHVAIPEADVPMHPEDLYMGKDVCITGMIEENPYGGATMTITSPAQFTSPDGKPF